MASGSSIQKPPGTRDLYPEDVLRQRFIQKAWRDAALRHGFDEIEGPTFETAELYAVKSGEGILGELFQAFSGKDPAEVEQVATRGRGPYALRPEFTPTLARMYAAHAKQLPKPCRWFTAGPYFRAERPQRGRLREFLQWNADVVGAAEGAAKEQATAEVIALAVGMLEAVGLTPAHVRIKLGSRDIVMAEMQRAGVDPKLESDVLALLDARPKMKADAYATKAQALGLPEAFVNRFHPEKRLIVRLDDTAETLHERHPGISLEDAAGAVERQQQAKQQDGSLPQAIDRAGLSGWCEYDSMIVRGLAYYTGTVFEAIADGERAVCGGGRYDNLIELFGGPETPAVGFGMGDVVLGLLLGDKGLIPEPAELRDALSLPSASLRPDAFVIAATDEAAAKIPGVLADLRRTTSMSDPAKIGFHARTTTKSTRNVGKLLKDAANSYARFAVILEGDGSQATLKDLASGDQSEFAPSELRAVLRSKLGR